MNSRAIRTPAIVFTISISLGCLLLLYSRTFVTDGIGAVSYWWAGGSYGHAQLNVSTSCPVVTKRITTCGLDIDSFNVSGGIVSNVVVGELNGTLLDQPMVTGEVSGMRFPSVQWGWVSPGHGLEERQHFNVTVLWEASNASVSFDFYTSGIIHADGSVYGTMPGFHQTQNLGFFLLEAGLAVFLVCTAVVLARSRH